MSAPGPNTTRWSSPRRWPKGSSTYATTSRSPADRRARGTRLPDARRALCWQTTRIRTGGVPRVVALPPRAIRCLGRAAVIVIVVGRSAAGAVRGVHGFAPALTSFVGRAGAVAEVARLLAERRLVTVTGPGGSGKTRLAAEVARGVADRFADGVWLVELAGVRDPAQVPSVVAAVLGVREQPGEQRVHHHRRQQPGRRPGQRRRAFPAAANRHLQRRRNRHLRQRLTIDALNPS